MSQGRGTGVRVSRGLTRRTSETSGNSMADDETHCRFCGGGRHLRDLDEELPQWWNRFAMVKVAERMEVPIGRIKGSVGSGRHYQPNWVPLVEEERDIDVLKSMKHHGFDLNESRASPITLVRYRNAYFVESDGHRRVSAALRLGLESLEAEVYRLRPLIQGMSKRR